LRTGFRLLGTVRIETRFRQLSEVSDSLLSLTSLGRTG
jgi:hypothetical protein